MTDQHDGAKRLSPERIEELRRRVQERLREIRQPPQAPQPQPRYDEVFFRGRAWLDGLAFEDEEE